MRRRLLSLARLTLCVSLPCVFGCQDADAPTMLPDRPGESSQEPAPDAPLPAPELAPTCPGGLAAPLVAGLRIREIALYQTVKVSLFADGAWSAAPSEPVVQGKPALVRVFVEALPGYRPRKARAVLRVRRGDEVTTLVDERTIFASSVEGVRESTFGFRLPGGLVGSASTLRVELQDVDCSLASASASDATAPNDGGDYTLGTVATGKLRVVVVPVSMNGRLPLTTESELLAIRDALAAHFPVSEVELSVRRPLIADATVPPGDEAAWSRQLSALARARLEDAADADVYYLGLMQPAATYADYCNRSCHLGRAFHLTERDPAHQVALVASFADAQTAISAVHELGHVHGCLHTACSEGAPPSGPDPNFPDASGATGVWGWDVRTDVLLPPTSADIMGYCANAWMSSYHYRIIAERVQQVNAARTLQLDMARSQDVMDPRP